MHRQASGATVPHLNVEDIRNLNTSPLPHDREQQEAAGVFLGALDDLIENNRRRIELLEQMAQAIYREWFVASAPEWETVRLGEIATAINDSVDPTEIDLATPAVGPEHIPRCSLTLREWGQAGELASRKTRFFPGDVLFGKIRPYFHKVCIAPIAGICSTDAIVLRATRAELRGLVAMVVFSNEFVAHAVTTSNGTKMPRADWKVLRDWPVPVPADDLLRTFNEATSSALALCGVLAAQARRLESLRDLLLPKLVTGAIDVSHLDLDSLLDQTAA